MRIWIRNTAAVVLAAVPKAMFFCHCSAQTVTRIGLLEEIPRSGVQIPCLY
jgi:hypothetical protein